MIFRYGSSRQDTVMKDASIVAKTHQPPAEPTGLDTTNRASPWRSRVLVSGLALGGLGAGIVGVSAYAALRLSRPRRTNSLDHPPTGSFEQVTFPSTDGLWLSGWFLPAPGSGSTVILCHGFQTGRREMLPVALALRERGHHVLLFDFRGHGESQGRWSSCGALETRDLEGAVRYLRSRPDLEGTRIGVLGFSMGAAVAILAAARVTEIEAVVADSAFATLEEAVAATLCGGYHLPRYPVVELALWLAQRITGTRVDDVRPVDAIPHLAPRPILLIHGVEDKVVPLSEAYLLYEAAGEARELWTVPGADHVGARTVDFQGYLERVDGFLKRQLCREPADAAHAIQGQAHS